MFVTEQNSCDGMLVFACVQAMMNEVRLNAGGTKPEPWFVGWQAGLAAIYFPLKKGSKVKFPGLGLLRGGFRASMCGGVAGILQYYVVSPGKN